MRRRSPRCASSDRHRNGALVLAPAALADPNIERLVVSRSADDRVAFRIEFAEPVVLIAESTIEMMSERPTDLVYYDELEIRGRIAKLKLWALDIRKPDDAPDLVAQREKDAKEATEKAGALT